MLPAEIEADMPVMAMLWSCMNEAIWFGAGFLLFRLASRCNLIPTKLEPSKLFARDFKGKGGKTGFSPKSSPATRCPFTREICEDGEAGLHNAVLSKWDEWAGKGRNGRVLEVAALEAVVEAMAILDPDRLRDMVQYLSEFSVRPGTVHSLVSSILKVSPEVAENFLEMLEEDKRTQRSLSSPKLRKLILGKFAAHGKVDKVKSILSKLEGDDHVSAANLAIRGFLEGRHTTVAVQQLKELSNGGSQVQAATVSAMLASNNKDFPISNVLEALQGMELPADAAAAVMGTCLKREDIQTARTLETRLRANGQLSFAVLEPLLKLMAKHDEASSFGLLQEIVDRKFFLSEGFCGLLLSRCGEAHHIQLAEAVQKYLRERKMTSLATYKTLMKVYATSDDLSRACDLYYDVIEDGIVPDTVMYGCLLKFAVKCGREDLSELLFNAASEKPQGNDVQNYMWLIRSAGQKHDVPRAVGLLRNLQQQVEYVDASVYNCVLDVCMNNAETELAETIFQEMVQKEIVTLVTYNTLLKGHSAKGNFERAKKLIQEMKAKGFSPNGASFNCLISAAVSAGRFQQAWTFYEDMLNSNISADSFTVCILLKIVRKAPHRPEAQRALAVLDNSKVDICKDEVLLNTVLDACIHLKDNKRLASVLRKFERATLKPSVQNYGLLIKAYSCMKQINKCWTVWHEMTDKHQQGLIPSDVALSCMLDAIVTSGQVEEAVCLFEQWQTVVPPNTIIFSNLIKGFASQGDAERAMKMYQRLKSQGLTMNLVAYSTLIDAQARAGNIDKAHALLEQMEQDGVKPNTVTYSSLVKGHCLKGDLDGALQVFQTMVAKGVKADTVMYNTILDGAVRASRFALCDQLIQEISQSGTDVSNFTLSIRVKMWGKRKQLEKAFAEVRKYSKAGTMQLDSKLCTCLISACFHNGAPDKALQALQEVKSLPNCDGPDVGTYEQLIEQLVKVRQSQEAAGVALEATSLAASGSIKPLSASALRQLQRHLVQSGHSYLWNKLKDELLAAQLPTP
mmetsp:Transcript_73021/g.116049  ORF Transcript_73021/g.116049 Transcript_73021/m.116049 type:complete len:1022 (-) Transcript_73021:59-3124(-)